MAPRPRFEKLDPAKQTSILEISAAHFAAHGYDGASLNAIIEESGISKGAFYYYFDDKADLFSTTLHHAWKALEPENPLDIPALTAGNFWEKVFDFFGEQSARAAEMPALAGLGRVVYNPPEDERVRRAIKEEFAQVFGLIHAILERGRELGLVRQDLPLELMVRMVAAASEAADRWFVGVWEELSPEQAEEMSLGCMDALRRLVSPPHHEQPSREVTP